MAIHVNGKRLWQRLGEMATIGATPSGGCNRQALTDADKHGRELFMDWCRQAGCAIRVDSIGNIFARRPGQEPGQARVLTGSHLDTQPTGGRFDGIFGVLAGLEVIDTLNDAGVRTRHDVEVAVWTNEEGCRFDTAMMGSAVWSGAMALEQAYALEDRDGRSVQEELERICHLGVDDTRSQPVKAAFEAHIEQGPILEAEGLSIGIVTGVQHMSRYRLHIFGQETHAGPTPMAMRKDPVMALADLLPALYGLAEANAPGGRMTVGYISTLPGSSNTVPGKLELTIDVRHPEQERYLAMASGLQQAVRSACGDHGMAYQLERFWEAPGVSFDPACIASVRQAVAEGGYPAMEMVSGAGHDACNLATVAPTSMIFIPCEGGISHNEAENTRAEWVEAGANVLLGAMLDQAGVIGGD